MPKYYFITLLHRPDDEKTDIDSVDLVELPSWGDAFALRTRLNKIYSYSHVGGARQCGRLDFTDQDDTAFYEVRVVAVEHTIITDPQILIDRAHDSIDGDDENGS